MIPAETWTAGLTEEIAQVDVRGTLWCPLWKVKNESMNVGGDVGKRSSRLL